MYHHLEQLLLTACQGKDVTLELENVCSFYKDDFQPELLPAQLITFGIDFQRVQRETYIYMVVAVPRHPQYLTSRNTSLLLQELRDPLLSQVCCAMKIILVMPASNSTSERSFSALRRFKNYLRSTMPQQRLNSLLVLHT